jgi:hypothetical protein
MVFRYDDDPIAEEIDLDMDGDKTVPEPGSFIERRGKRWRVLQVNVETSAIEPFEVPIHRAIRPRLGTSSRPSPWEAGAGWTYPEKETEVALVLTKLRSEVPSRRAAFSDLQPAACFLYAAKLGSAGCCDSTGDASHQPRDEAPVSTQHGRESS